MPRRLFISEDPIGWASGQANNYAYVGGDPIGYRDPYGTLSFGAMAGFAFKAWGAYQAFEGGCEAAMAYQKMNDATDEVFSQRRADEDTYTPDQEVARTVAHFGNFADAFGKPIAKAAFGIGMMSVKGGGVGGFVLNVAVTAGGAAYGTFMGGCP